MNMDIYNLKNTPTGKEPGNICLANIKLNQEGIIIECYDKKLKDKLKDIFSQPIVKRVEYGKKWGLYSHRNEIVQPFTENFFEEILFILSKYELAGKIVK